MTTNRDSRRISPGVACCCTAGALFFSQPATSETSLKDPVLVELFTSQNCPACPAANEKLIELSETGDIFPLTWSVSYWDYLGWKDSFAQPEFNTRQRKYADTFNLRGPYTPQTVVDGCVQTTGKMSAKKVREKIDLARHPHGPSVNFDVSPTSVLLTGTQAIPEADILLVGYLPGITAVVPDKGLNRKKMLSHINMVTSLKPLGTWKGEGKTSFEFLCPDEACVVIIQDSASRDILAFSEVPDPPETDD